MSIYKLFNRKSVVVTWILSYVAILILPITISVITYVRMERVVENEINRYNDSFLKQVRQYMDGIINDVVVLSTEMAFNSRIQQFTNVKQPVYDEQRYQVYECVKEINGLKLSRNLKSNFYIYFKKSDLVLNETTGMESKNFYDIFIDKSNFSYEQWLQMLQKQYRGEYKSVSNSGKERSVLYMRSIPLVKQEEILANIVVQIDESQFLKMTEDAEELNRGRVIILDGDDQIIADSGTSKIPDELVYENLAANKGFMYGYQENDKVAISYISSQTGSWKYIYIMPTRIYWEKLEYTRKLMMLSIILCVFLGSILTLVLLKRNYAPVRKLVSALASQSQWNQDGEANEYNFISKAIGKALEDKDEISKRLEVQNNVLKCRFIERLLKGKISQASENDSLASFNIAFNSDYFAVMLFYIKDFSEFMWDEPNNDYMESFKLFQFIMTNVLEEVIGRENQGFITEVDEAIVCLVNFKEENVDRAEREMLQAASEVQDFIKQHFKMQITVSLSTMHQTIQGIAEAYNEANEAMEYKLVMGIDRPVSYNNIKDSFGGDYYYPIDKEQQLINCIKAGDFEKSRLVLDEVFNKNFSERTLSPQIAKCLIFNLISTILKVVNEVSSVSGNDFRNEIIFVEELVHNKNINEVKQGIIDVINIFCEHVYTSKGKNSQLNESVKEYILKNYTDENLSISAIADEIGMHPTYISKLFKEQEGKGILDFLNNLRIERSKEVMKDRKMNLEDIARVVGYSNVRTFSRAFIKNEGITPGKFREML